MFFLKLFAGASIESPAESPLPHRALQRHRLALLALLALHPRGLSRDKLIAYLWPESDGKRGRNLLNVSVYVLRESLGEEAIVSRGDDLRLNREQIRADVVEFEAAVDRGDHASAVALYGGPFLDGFFLSEAREFELWTDIQRERLADMYANALESLACAAEAAGDALGALEWWKKRVAHDRFDSRVVVRLMQALDSIGNRAGALELADVHGQLLRQEFGTRPASEVIALAERLRTVPDGPPATPPDAVRPPVEAAGDRTAVVVSRPAVPVSPAEPRSNPGSPPPTEQPSGRPAGDRRRPAWQVLVGAFMGIVVLSLTLRAAWSEADVPQGSIAVLPFANLGLDDRDDYFSDGVTEEIITRMASVSGLKVISRTSVATYKNSDRPLRRIAEELGVAHVLEGSVRKADGRVRISAQLIDAETDHHVWAATYDRALVDIFAVQEQIARDVVQALEIELAAGDEKLLGRRGTNDPEAFELFLRGRHQWTLRTLEDNERAREYFRRAIARDSSYGDPHAGLAYTYLTDYQLGFSSLPDDEVYALIKGAAEQALALDETSADAHVALATALWWQRNWPGAERELRRALELNPGHAIARTWYALLLVGWGRVDEALAHATRAADLDPFAVATRAIYAHILYHARRYDEAIEQWRKAAEVGGLGWGMPGVGISLALAGDASEAIRVLREAIAAYPDRPDLLASLAYAVAVAGDRAEAAALLAQAKERGAPPFDLARAHVALAEPDSALAWLPRASWHWAHRGTRFDPALDPLRSDPRFAEMSARIERDLGIGPAR